MLQYEVCSKMFQHEVCSKVATVEVGNFCSKTQTHVVNIAPKCSKMKLSTLLQNPNSWSYQTSLQNLNSWSYLLHSSWSSHEVFWQVSLSVKIHIWNIIFKYKWHFLYFKLYFIYTVRMFESHFGLPGVIMQNLVFGRSFKFPNFVKFQAILGLGWHSGLLRWVRFDLDVRDVTYEDTMHSKKVWFSNLKCDQIVHKKHPRNDLNNP